MPPKPPRKKEDSTVPSLPTINPVLTAAQVKFDKWVKRVQELTRAKTDAIRLKSGLVLTLREGEAKVRAVTAEADTIAFQPLRPPPPPPSQPITPVPPNGSGGGSKTSRKSNGNIKTVEAPAAEPWRAPEPAEARKLQKAGEGLIAAYLMKRGGPDKPSENEKGRGKGSLYKRRVIATDAPSSLATATALMSEAASPQSPHSPMSADAALSSPATASPSSAIKGKGKKGAGKNSDADAAGADGVSPGTATVMVSLSLGAGAAVVVPEPLPEPPANGKGSKSPRSQKNKGKDKGKDAEPHLDSAGTTTLSTFGAVTALPPITSGTPTLLPNAFPEERGSFRGLDGLGASTSPLADGMEKPKGATYAQWTKILQLRQDRLDLEDVNALTREQAIQARDRVNQLKEMEAIGRYSLAAAQKDLEALTGTAVPPIPGITAPLPVTIPQPPSTPRSAAAALGLSAASPEGSPTRVPAATR